MLCIAYCHSDSVGWERLWIRKPSCKHAVMWTLGIKHFARVTYCPFKQLKCCFLNLILTCCTVLWVRRLWRSMRKEVAVRNLLLINSLHVNRGITGPLSHFRREYWRKGAKAVLFWTVCHSFVSNGLSRCVLDVTVLFCLASNSIFGNVGNGEFWSSNYSIILTVLQKHGKSTTSPYFTTANLSAIF